MPEGGETGLHLVLIGCAVERAGFSRQAVVEAGLRKLGPTAAHSTSSRSKRSRRRRPRPAPSGSRSRCRPRSAWSRSDPGALRPRHLLLSLLRRVSTLAERHGGALLDLDYRALKERAEPPEVAAELRWVEWARWSGRQQTLLRMGGLLGSLALPLAGLEPFWPFLALAPWVHVGKGATMGLGAMRVDPA